MSRLNFYYRIKPFVPWSIRFAIRRFLAKRKLKKVSHVWPIDKMASKKPEDWKGWPHEKQFAFVLTHDVEGKKGLDKVRKLAELEMELGFRSSFNFIPEGEYETPVELITWLQENSFEVGVHDLKHDGKLFASKKGFISASKRINHYLSKWNAVGYRSGFMLRNLEWLKRLNIEYDASTFDTDPFEPMPNGACTIFPYWYGDASGYVELPYTLPQDSTAFLLFQDKGPNIWNNKLKWLAKNGGMALLNVHPDYIDFDGKSTNATFPVNYYRDFLVAIKTKYDDAYWQPLPSELASWYKATRNPPLDTDQEDSLDTRIPNLSGKRAAVFLFSYYPDDPRPRRAAEAMAMSGMEVDVFCLREDQEPDRETINGVNIIRIPIRKRRDSKFSYVKQYGAFFLACAYHSARRIMKNRYDVVHTHNMPDFLVFASLIPSMFGAKRILDLHDPMPELMMGIYNLEERSSFVRALKIIEKLSIAYTNLAITPNSAFRDLFTSRSCSPEKMAIVMNTPEQSIFDPDLYTNDGNKDSVGYKIMHHGSIVHRHGLDILVDAFAKVQDVIPEATLEIYGSANPYLEEVLERAKQLSVADSVNYHGKLSQKEIAEEIRRCSIGVVPNRRSSFTETNFPTRLFEYLCMDKPVIAPSTIGIREYFDNSQMLYFNPDLSGDLAKQLIWAYKNPDRMKKIAQAGKGIYRKHLWREERIHFLNNVSDVLN